MLSVMRLPSWDAARLTPPGPNEYESAFQKPSESAHPGSYAVTLDKGHIVVRKFKRGFGLNRASVGDDSGDFILDCRPICDRLDCSSDSG